MSFTPEQVKALAAKLDPSAVATREQSGRRLSYVEGWHVIAEANRIFGFDAWHRETIDIRCVMEKERKIGRAPNQKDGWGVSYIARCRVVVDGVTREGVGAGHGIDADLGLAHESAIKEAETDAMKRALMTFGNPFGLALYDKSQENVGRDEPAKVSTIGHQTPKGRTRRAGERLADAYEITTVLDALKENMKRKPTPDALKQWATAQRVQIGSLPDAAFDEFMDQYEDEMAELNAARTVA